MHTSRALISNSLHTLFTLIPLWGLPTELYVSTSNIKEECVTYTCPKEVEANHIGDQVIRFKVADSISEQGVQPSAFEIVQRNLLHCNNDQVITIII